MRMVLVSIRSATSNGGTYICYLLASSSHSQRTYVGVTNNISRRLRQHNGHIVGGAKATRVGRPWSVWVTVEGFPDQRSSLQFEWMWKHSLPRKSHGKRARIRKLRDLLRKERWTENAPLASSVPSSVKVYQGLGVERIRDECRRTDGANQWVLEELVGQSNDIKPLPTYVKVQSCVMRLESNEKDPET